MAVARTPSLYSEPIAGFETICFGLGLGIAVGLVTGATGVEGSARGRMAVVSAVIGLVIGYLLGSLLDGEALLAGLAALVASAFGCAVFSDVRAGANRRGATAILGLGFVLAALVIAGLTVLLPWLGLLFLGATVWLAVTRGRRGPEKHAGLRVLR